MLSYVTDHDLHIVAVFIGVACLVGGVAVMFRPEEGTVAEDRLQMLTGKGKAKNGHTAEGALLAQIYNESPNLIAQFLQRFGNLSQLMEQADMQLDATKFLMISIGFAAAGIVIPVIMGLHFAVALILPFILAFMPLFYVMMKRSRRVAAFGKQLPDALELIGRALRAGHSLAAAIHLVATEMNDPIRKECARCYDEQNLGIPLEETLEKMAERVPNVDLRFFVTAVILQRQTGGDLAEILDKIGHLIRERFKIFGQIAALTGEGRLSGIVLLALPPVLFVVMYRMNPDYCMVLFTDPMGQQMLGIAIVMQFVGAARH